MKTEIEKGITKCCYSEFTDGGLIRKYWDYYPDSNHHAYEFKKSELVISRTEFIDCYNKWIIGKPPIYVQDNENKPEKKLKKKLKKINIFWDNLTLEKQAELLEAFGGENGNYDIIPLATIEMEDTEDLLKIEVANKIWDIAKISPEHGNALMDLLGTEVYEKISMIQTSNSKKEE